MDRFSQIVVQIRNLNPEVALHFMLLALRPNKFTDIWCKKPYNNMDELHEQAKRNIQMEEMSMFWNEVQQAWHKREKGKSSERTDSYKLDKQHKLDKRQPILKGPKYERYTPLTANRATILEEVFNAKIPIQLPPIPSQSLSRVYK